MLNIHFYNDSYVFGISFDSYCMGALVLWLWEESQIQEVVGLILKSVLPGALECGFLVLKQAFLKKENIFVFKLASLL